MKLKDFERKNSKGYKYYQFDNMNSLLKLIEENDSICYTRSRDSNAKDFVGFYGTDTFEQAIDYAKHGWTTGIEQMKTKINVKAQNDQFKNVYDVAGGHVSVPRYLVGVPTNMIRKVPVERKDKVITVVRFCAALGSVSTNTMIENAIKFVQIIQNLEANGYRCNVDVAFGSSKNYIHDLKPGDYKNYSVVRVRIKKSSERLNIAKMCFPLVHPSMFRRLVFRLREMNEDYSYWAGPGDVASFYRSTYNSHDGDNFAKKFVNKNEYIVPMFINNVEGFKLEAI